MRPAVRARQLRAGVVAVVLALAAGVSVRAQVYRWTDADGNVHFGQSPPVDCASTQLRAASSGPAALPASGATAREESPEVRQAQRRERCEQARARLEVLAGQ